MLGKSIQRGPGAGLRLVWALPSREEQWVGLRWDLRPQSGKQSAKLGLEGSKAGDSTLVIVNLVCGYWYCSAQGYLEVNGAAGLARSLATPHPAHRSFSDAGLGLVGPGPGSEGGGPE